MMMMIMIVLKLPMHRRYGYTTLPSALMFPLYLAYRIAYRMWPTQEGLARPLESIRQTLTKCRLILVSHLL